MVGWGGVAALLCPDCMKAGAVVFRCPQSRGVVVLRSRIFRIINVRPPARTYSISGCNLLFLKI